MHVFEANGGSQRLLLWAIKTEVLGTLTAATLFREDSPKPLFTSLNDAWADYSNDFGPCPVRAGVHWNSLNF